MASDLSDILLAIAGFGVVTLFGISLWEVRALRADNKDLRNAITALTSSIAALTNELSHKVSKEDCATNRIHTCNYGGQ